MTPDIQTNLRTYTRKSSRKSNIPFKLSDYVLDRKIKYDIHKSINYSNLSKENYVFFFTSPNKVIEPKIYNEAIKDSRWIDAMNLEIEVLHINNTWVIVELPVGINNTWVIMKKHFLQLSKL